MDVTELTKHIAFICANYCYFLFFFLWNIYFNVFSPTYFPIILHKLIYKSYTTARVQATEKVEIKGSAA